MADINLPASFITRIEHVADFRQAERNGVIRLDGNSHGLSAITVDPGGDVQTEHFFTALIDQFDDLPVKAAHFPVQAGAKDGIHDAMAVQHVHFDFFGGLKGLNYDR